MVYLFLGIFHTQVIHASRVEVRSMMEQDRPFPVEERRLLSMCSTFLTQNHHCRRFPLTIQRSLHNLGAHLSFQDMRARISTRPCNLCTISKHNGKRRYCNPLCNLSKLKSRTVRIPAVSLGKCRFILLCSQFVQYFQKVCPFILTLTLLTQTSSSRNRAPRHRNQNPRFHRLNQWDSLVHRVSPPFHTPAHFSPRFPLLQVRKLPQMMHSIQFSNLHEPGTYAFHDFPTSLETCPPVLLPFK